MDKRPSPLINLTTRVAPAMIWVGSPDALTDRAINYLQHQFCKKNGCRVCITCVQIREQKHHAVTWITPEKQYTTETLEPLFDKIAFALDEGEKHFFILQKAELLTPTCANSLLKSVEEPPAGYNFIFLTQNLDAILPTIQSRCTIQHLQKTDEPSSHTALFEQFTLITDNPLGFLKILDQSKINEHESVELLNKLLEYWIKKTQNAPTKEQARMIKLLENAILNPPMPGGAKIMWRNLYLQTRS